jgi:hypothetical protein
MRTIHGYRVIAFRVYRDYGDRSLAVIEIWLPYTTYVSCLAFKRVFVFHGTQVYTVADSARSTKVTRQYMQVQSHTHIANVFFVKVSYSDKRKQITVYHTCTWSRYR